MKEYKLRSTVTRTGSKASRWADKAVILGICALLVFALFRFILIPVRVRNDKMHGLAGGELLLVDRISRFVSDYTLGDIVRIRLSGRYDLFRVAAEGGSTYRVSGGRAYLDDALLDESEYSAGWPEGLELYAEVPEDSLLLLPDDRTDITSLDEFVVRYNDVYGEVRFRIAPLNKLAFFC
ncbi:MAG: hypothetical protein IJM18_07260 [Clostridia bacterium]|jgi:hypothetical protein|nr:hypothetical protein [Clostridia bacterium]